MKKKITLAVLFSSVLINCTQLSTASALNLRNMSRIAHEKTEIKVSDIDHLIKLDKDIYESTTIDQEEIASIKQRIRDDEIPELLLINKSNPIDVDFVHKLVNNDTPSTRKMQINKQALDALHELFAHSKKSNIKDLVTVSIYRDIDYQRKLFKREMNLYLKQHSAEEAYAIASKAVTPPGTSEHQSGLAVDFISTTNYKLDSSFEKTPAGSWLIENAYKYGFILRYPKDKTDITDIIYEPWHYRYVGKIHAGYMHEQQITLEEYYTELKRDEIIKYKSEDGHTYEIYYIENLEIFDFNKSNIKTDNIQSISKESSNSSIVVIKLQ